MFKITKLIKVKAYENGHDLWATHNTWTLTVSASIGCLQTHFFDIFVIFFAKIINNTENICNFVIGNLHNSYCLNLCNYLIYNYKDNKIMRDYQTFKTLFLSRTQVISIIGKYDEIDQYWGKWLKIIKYLMLFHQNSCRKSQKGVYLHRVKSQKSVKYES